MTNTPPLMMLEDSGLLSMPSMPASHMTARSAIRMLTNPAVSMANR